MTAYQHNQTIPCPRCGGTQTHLDTDGGKDSLYLYRQDGELRLSVQCICSECYQDFCIDAGGLEIEKGQDGTEE